MLYMGLLSDNNTMETPKHMPIAVLLKRLENIQDGIDGDRFTYENIQELIKDIINTQK